MTARNEIIHGISATRASAILGLNQWKTPVLAWQEIMEKLKPAQYDEKGVCTYRGFNAERGYILPEREDKAVFRWGNAFESAVIELAEQAQSDIIGAREQLFEDSGEPSAFGYVDGVYSKGASHKKIQTLCEAKTTFERAYQKSWGLEETDRVPEHIQIQTQHCMMISGASETIVSVLVLPFSVDDLEKQGLFPFSGNSITKNIENPSQGGSVIGNIREWAHVLAQMGYFKQYIIAAKPDIHKALRGLYNDFWKKFILTETPPTDDLDYSDILRLFPAPKGVIVVTDRIEGVFRELRDINAEIGSKGHLPQRKKVLKTELLDYMRKSTTVEDEDSVEKVTCKDSSGNNLGSYNGTKLYINR